MGHEYDVSEWKLFIDSSSRSLKVVLPNNGNKLSSIPVGLSVEMKETYNSMETLLKALKYKEQRWLVCGDIKVVALVLGMLSLLVG